MNDPARFTATTHDDPDGTVQHTTADPALGRGPLSALRGLLVLSQLMMESSNEPQILELAQTAVPALAATEVVGILLADGRWDGPAALTEAVHAQVPTGQGASGELALPELTWSYAYALPSLRGHLGHLVVGAAKRHGESEQFLLRALAQQTGAALANARLHTQERDATAALEEVNQRLEHTIVALRRSMEIHDRLTEVAASGAGRVGIAKALHELTGFPIAVEDRYGNLIAWCGPDRPDPYLKDPTVRREQLLRRAVREGKPVRDGARLLAVARPRPDLVGAIVLLDPDRRSTEQELMALEHGTTVLAMELARIRSLAESELRVRRDLVDDLLTGTEEDSALRRAQALGYDLQRPHRVVVIEGRDRSGDAESFLHGVRRAARDEPVGSLLVSRGEQVIILADHEPSWDAFRVSVLRQLGGGRCRVGVGSRCVHFGRLPESYRQATHALELQAALGWPDGAIRFDDLGVFQLLATAEDTGEIVAFVDRWLGALVAYDTERNGDLVLTLTQYLEHGGAYDATSTALCIHRSTLKYRLQRIREISGHDLTDPDTRFNLQLATRAQQTLRTARPTDPHQPGARRAHTGGGVDMEMRPRRLPTGDMTSAAAGATSASAPTSPRMASPHSR